jgi:hypothetical protein
MTAGGQCVGKFADAAACSQLWRCNNKAQCSGGVCCYQNGGTSVGCPITTMGNPTTSCLPNIAACEGASYRMLCADDSDCLGSGVSTKCKPLKDPGGNIVGVCSQ